MLGNLNPSVLKRSMASPPYLKPNRLGDVIAAIQAMASSEYYRRSSEQWATALSGTIETAPYWQKVFDEYPEFFRHAPATDDDEVGERYSLVWRRALPHVHITTQERIRYRDYERLSEEQKHQYPRAQLSENAVGTLIQIAVSLHSKALEERKDWRWLFAPVLSFCGALLGAVLAFLASAFFH
jgi:hypothetical protein